MSFDANDHGYTELFVLLRGQMRYLYSHHHFDRRIGAPILGNIRYAKDQMSRYMLT